MSSPTNTLAAAAAALVLSVTGAAADLPLLPPHATVDLATAEGAASVQATWRYHEAALAGADFREPGPDGKPSGRPNRTWEVVPQAGEKGFDDSTWEVLDPAALDERRSTGKVCFAWYRLRFVVPGRIGAALDPTGATVVFEVVVDDYAEVWVDGELRRELGQSGGAVVAGFNVPNRLVVGRDVRPGQEISVAVFAMNGPISAAPANYIWIRSARLDFHLEPRGVEPTEVPVVVERLDPALDAIVPAAPRMEKLAEGFLFGEGPVWVPEGYLLFSDPNANRIYRWSEAKGVSVFRERSGYAGADVAAYRQPGSNGLTLDRLGRLTICEHGNRRVSRLEKDGTATVVADRYDGRRLNSPNDLVERSDGTLFFTDPPFGLPQVHADPRRELDVTGVFRVRDGEVELVSDDLSGPNGIALAPDEKTLYVANWDEKAKVVMRYDVARDGTLSRGRVLFDMGSAPEPEALDGLKVDRRGNLYVSGPGGVWILSSEGRHLGTIRGPELPANFAWGDADGRTLYMTARTGLYRMRLEIPGIRPTPERLLSLGDGR
jgi:gluconolactonase